MQHKRFESRVKIMHNFVREDWLNYEHARDVLHYYRAESGSIHGVAMAGCG